jgi:hypothetical protein
MYVSSILFYMPGVYAKVEYIGTLKVSRGLPLPCLFACVFIYAGWLSSLFQYWISSVSVADGPLFDSAVDRNPASWQARAKA